MSWVYEQSTGKLTDPEGEVIGVGYAGGDCGKSPEGVNNPTMQAAENVGPLPRGTYTVGKVIERHPKLGNFVLPLTPDPANQMFGRSGFFIHGDNIARAGQRAASDGCIVVALDVRESVNASMDRLLEVIAGPSVILVPNAQESS